MVFVYRSGSRDVGGKTTVCSRLAERQSFPDEAAARGETWDTWLNYDIRRRDAILRRWESTSVARESFRLESKAAHREPALRMSEWLCSQTQDDAVHSLG